MPDSASEASRPGGERAYLAHLLFFVCFATLFEGYDLLIINLSLPYLGEDFGADSRTLGTAVGLINVGTIAAFVPVRLADRYGRRALFLAATTGYTAFTILSAFSLGLYDFVAYQCAARMFMVTEIGIGAIILTEETPARWRGAAVTLMFAFGLTGGVLGSAIFPYLVDSERSWRTLLLAATARDATLHSGARSTRRRAAPALAEFPADARGLSRGLPQAHTGGRGDLVRG